MAFLKLCALKTFVWVAFAATTAAAGWTNLLDQDLSQWENYLSYSHQVSYNGSQPLDGNGKPIQPIGYNKNSNQVFSVVKLDGQLALRVSGEIYGCLYTKQSFENYRFRVKVKWGHAKWDPRKDKLRDSGILYHSNGEAGVDYWRAWMLAQEFQIMEGHMGDYWAIANSAIDIRAFLPEGTMNSIASPNQPFLSFGAAPSVSGFCLRSENHESAMGEWTQLELICFQGKSLHLVNDQVVMILMNSRVMKEGQSMPMTKGKIQLQSEASEVYFTDIKIQTIEALPKEYKKLFE